MKHALRYLVPLFLLGIAFGIGYSLGQASHPVGSMRFENRDELRKRILARMTDELELSSEQQASLKEILEERRQSFRALRKQVRPQFRQIHQETRARIREILNEEQQKKFAVMAEEFDRKRRERKLRKYGKDAVEAESGGTTEAAE